MSQINSFFGKSPNDLRVEDIENFFNEEKTESDRIEFKSYVAQSNNHESLTLTIIETISALLNSSGGLIIWGAPKGQKVSNQKEKIFQGELLPVTQKIEKDSFINKISTLITPTPIGVRFYEFPKDNHYVYLIEVDQSIYSPHQFGGKYSMRLDGQNRPAPHHYIEALFRKVSFPNLIGEVKFLKGTKTVKDEFLCSFELKARNLSPFQNEENLQISFRSTRGIVQNYDFFRHPDVSYNAGSLTHRNAKPVFFFGELFIAEINLLYSSEEISTPIFVTITFGGKSSPLRKTEYLFKLEFIQGRILETGMKKISENEFLQSIYG